VPAREVGAADVAHLARAHEVVERAQRLLDARERVEAVELVEVHVVRAEAAQARLAGPDQVEARRADVVRSRAGAKGSLRRDDHLLAAAGDGLAQDLLREARRVDVGGVEHVEAGLETDVYEPGSLVDPATYPRLEELAASAERARAEAEDRNAEAGATEGPGFHQCALSAR